MQDFFVSAEHGLALHARSHTIDVYSSIVMQDEALVIPVSAAGLTTRLLTPLAVDCHLSTIRDELHAVSGAFCNVEWHSLVLYHIARLTFSLSGIARVQKASCIRDTYL